MSSKARRIFQAAGIVLALAVIAYCIELAVPKRDYFVRRAGSIVDQRHIQTRDGDTWQESVHLVSSSGLEVDLRVYRPHYDGTQRLPVLLMLSGYRTGKDAVDLVGAPQGMAFAAIDYPYDGRYDLSSFWGSIVAVPGFQRAFLDSPPALLLALSWLLDQPWVDQDRVELAGISLGVPFAAPAGALDKRFARVWLMHGGADNAAWVGGLARRRTENGLVRATLARLILFAVYGNSFDTQSWINEITPRPLIIVMARDDGMVPKEAQKSFLVAAESPSVELIWTEGRHIAPKHNDELEQVLGIVRDRITGIGDSATEDSR